MSRIRCLRALQLAPRFLCCFLQAQGGSQTISAVGVTAQDRWAAIVLEKQSAALVANTTAACLKVCVLLHFVESKPSCLSACLCDLRGVDCVTPYRTREGPKTC